MKNSLCVIMLMVCVLLVSCGYFQDRAGATATGNTGKIAGHVILSDTILARRTVGINGSTYANVFLYKSGSNAWQDSVRTDLSGAFAFDSLPAGTYSVKAVGSLGTESLRTDVILAKSDTVRMTIDLGSGEVVVVKTVTSNSSTNLHTIDFGVLTDSRDGQKYRTVVVGSQKWMAQNMNYQPTSGNSWCYNDTAKYCNAFGRLYDYPTASTVCPTGWHLPDTTEWNVLIAYAGGVASAGSKLRSPIGWKYRQGIINSDDYGFSALPSETFDSLTYGHLSTDSGNVAFWWTANSYGSFAAWDIAVGYDDSYVYITNNAPTDGYAVRCLNDVPTSVLIYSSSSESSSSSLVAAVDSFTDSRDGSVYKTVLIGSQTWMKQNLNFAPTSGIGVCYNNAVSYCGIYGRLYDYKTALTACPMGWHLPDTTEWNTLTSFVGGDSVAGNKLKANNYWSLNIGTDDYGFRALAGGSVLYDSTSALYRFYQGGDVGYWWSATAESGASHAFPESMNANDAWVWGGIDYVDTISKGFSVRCLKNIQ